MGSAAGFIDVAAAQLLILVADARVCGALDREWTR
jgi:hypothetical protein